MFFASFFLLSFSSSFVRRRVKRTIAELEKRDPTSSNPKEEKSGNVGKARKKSRFSSFLSPSMFPPNAEVTLTRPKIIISALGPAGSLQKRKTVQKTYETSAFVLLCSFLKLLSGRGRRGLKIAPPRESNTRPCSQWHGSETPIYQRRCA